MKILNALANIPMFVLWNVHRSILFAFFVQPFTYRQFLQSDRAIFFSTWITILSILYMIAFYLFGNFIAVVIQYCFLSFAHLAFQSI